MSAAPLPEVRPTTVPAYPMRPGVARLALEALNDAPIIGRTEGAAWFRYRQDKWLRERWGDAVRLLQAEVEE